MRKSWPLVGIIILVCMAILVLILILVFKPVDGEAEAYWELYSQDWGEQFSQDDFERVIEANKEQVEQFKESESESVSRDYGIPIKSIKLNPSRFDPTEIKVNTLVYTIAQSALMNKGINSINTNQFMDPLILLAQANAELGGVREGEFKILAPALPVCRMDRASITEDAVKSFNFVRAVKLDVVTAFNSGNGSYIGPLQLGKDYGSPVNTNQTLRKALVYNQSEFTIVGTDTVALNKVNATKASTQSTTVWANILLSKDTVGDRWNWNDACIRAVAQWDADYKETDSARRNMLTSKFMLACVLGLDHNVGSSVFASKSLDTKSSLFIKTVGEDNATIGDAWNFCKWLSSPSVVSYIEQIAKANIAANKLTYRPDKNFMNTLIEKFGNTMDANTKFRMTNDGTWHSSSYGDSVQGWETEPPRHALVVLYNYIMLEQLYSGV